MGSLRKMLVLESSDLLLLDEGDRFLVGELENDGAAQGVGLLGLFWRSEIGGMFPECVACPIEEMEIPELETESLVTTAAIRVAAAAPGAVRICLLDSETGEEFPFENGLLEIPLIEGRLEYAWRVCAENSRGNRVARDLTLSVSPAEKAFAVTKDLFPLKVFAQSDRLTFGARLASETGRQLCRSEVSGCRAVVYRLQKNSRGTGRAACHTHGGAGVPVPLASFADRLDASFPWRRDRIGGNFRYTPPVPLGEFCGPRGAYDVAFTVTLKNGTEIVFEYSILVGGRAGTDERNIPFG